jgi:hypothetical protein
MVGVILTCVVMGVSLVSLSGAPRGDKYDAIVGKYVGRTLQPCQVIADEVDKSMDADSFPHEINLGVNEMSGNGHVWVEANNRRYDIQPRGNYKVKMVADGLKADVKDICG